jgi:hypothetical protein
LLIAGLIYSGWKSPQNLRGPKCRYGSIDFLQNLRGPPHDRGPLAQCSPLRSTADNDAIEQTNIKQTSVAQLYLLGAVGAS